MLGRAMVCWFVWVGLSVVVVVSVGVTSSAFAVVSVVTSLVSVLVSAIASLVSVFFSLDPVFGSSVSLVCFVGDMIKNVVVRVKALGL